MTLNSSTQLCNKNLKTNLQIRPIWYNSRRAAIIPRLLRSERSEREVRALRGEQDKEKPLPLKFWSEARQHPRRNP